MGSKEGKGQKRPLRVRTRTHRLPGRPATAASRLQSPAAWSASGTSENSLAEETLASLSAQGQGRVGERDREQGAGLPSHMVLAASRDAGAVRVHPAPRESRRLGFACSVAGMPWVLGIPRSRLAVQIQPSGPTKSSGGSWWLRRLTEREKHQLVVSHMHQDPGWSVPEPGIRTHNPDVAAPPGATCFNRKPPASGPENIYL
ncbi:uncharacterized protein LOC123807727 [Phyllostomus hastatus]|uniref:uncharacterized protein LOC123807727 n=1 Tax=Phyllostomus hastatus TaxID=9423 RepID=UPI001E6843DE|nr:uncharacterized protein LOC123807727 [Phyllostomus hastatus]